MYILFFLAKSPYKLSTTERHVINGLKQLTELLFKQHFKPNLNEEDNVDENNEPLQSNEVSTSIEYPTSTNSNMQNNKENHDDGQQCQANSNTNDEGENFCRMIIQQLKAGDAIKHSEEWHRGQLDAYNIAHKRIFERTD